MPEALDRPLPELCPRPISRPIASLDTSRVLSTTLQRARLAALTPFSAIAPSFYGEPPFSILSTSIFCLHPPPPRAPPRPSQGSILAPRPLSSKWTSLDVPSGSRLTVYMSLGRNAPSHSPHSLSSSVSFLSSQIHASSHEQTIIEIP